MKARHLAFAAAALAGASAFNPAMAADKINMVIFGPPSLGALFPPVIKAQKLDAKHGLDITFNQRPPSAYTAQFNSGEFKVGGSAALLTVGLGDVRGVKISYLFNIFDYFGAVVTNRAEIKSLKDLEGKQIAAARATTNFKMFQFLAGRQGVDVSKIKVVNTAPPGLVGYAMADRAEAVQMWEPALTTLRARKPSVRVLDLNIAREWKKYAGSENVPYLGVAAHQDWIEKNKKLIPKLFAAYKDAAEWAQKNPDAAAKLVLPKGNPASLKAISDLLKAKDRLGLNFKMAGEIEKEIKQVYKAGQDLKYLPKAPSDATIYKAN